MEENITFAFQSGRKKRLEDPNSTYAHDFFYTYHIFKKNFNNVNIIEFTDSNNYLIKKVFQFIRYLTTIPFYTEKIKYKKNKEIIQKTTHLICTNQRVAFSLLPYVLKNCLNKKIKISIFIMGLFLDQKRHFIRRILRHSLIFCLCGLIQNLFFLSKNEMKFAKSKFPRYAHKFHFIPFAVDVDFWKPNLSFNQKEYLLFIGNDEKRDFEFVKKLSKRMDQFKFILISNFLNSKDFEFSKNIQVINGKWSDDTISDVELRSIYDKSILSLIPLLDSHQPSGQSVALQSMSMKVPVIITETVGFWEKEKFENNKNIFFMKENNLENWEIMIKKLIENKELLKSVAYKGNETVLENYNLDNFYKKIVEIIFN